MIDIACPLCGGSGSSPVCQIQDVTYGIPGKFTVVRCRQCTHIYLNPRPSDACLMDCYPSEYAPHSRGGLRQDSPAQSNGPKPDVRVQSQLGEVGSDRGLQQHSGKRPGFARRLLRGIPGARAFLNWLGQEHATWLPKPAQPGHSRLLEVGCAHGGFLKQAESLGWVVDGIEPSASAVAAACEKGLQVLCGRLEDAGIETGSRDVVAMWMVLEHVPNPREVIRESARVLTADGHLAFSVPNAGSWERIVFGRHWLGYDAPRHLQMFQIRSLRRLLGEEGFQRVRIIHQSNTRYWWGSIAAWGKLRFPDARWPERWMEYFRGEPPAWWNWILMVPGKIASLLRCSGRITVVASKK